MKNQRPIQHQFSRQKLNPSELKAITCYVYKADTELFKLCNINLTALVRDSLRRAAAEIEATGICPDKTAKPTKNPARKRRRSPRLNAK